MLVLHVYVLGRNGSVERSYDFLRNDGKEAFEGCDVVVPYKEDVSYPMDEREVVAYLHNDYLRKDH